LASLLFGAVSADQQLEVIRDVGLLATELFGLAAACLGAVTLILTEIESRSLYLILARPIPRWYYIVGRAAGLWGAVFVAVLAMGAFHGGLLFFKGAPLDGAFLRVYPFIGMKLAVITSLGVALSVFSSSSASALVFTAAFWMTGNFVQEIRFMAEKVGPGVEFLIKAVIFSVPNLPLLNARDALALPKGVLAFGPALCYTVGYTTISLIVASFLFSKKEF